MRFLTTHARHNPWNYRSAWDLLSQFDDELASLQDDAEQAVRPVMDFEHSKDDYKFTFDMPGMKKEDIKVDLDGRLLTIRGERRFEKKSEGRYERKQGVFTRSIQLPEDVNTESIQATYENGVLELVITKTEKAKAREIKVS